AIESFNETILHWFARFNELERHTVIFGPVRQRDGDQFWAIVQPQFERIAALSGYPIERSYYAWCRQVEFHLDRQAFTIAVIHHVEGAKATITPQSITHKVCRPTFVDCFRHYQRSGTSCRQTSFAFSFFVQFQAAINAIDPFVVPTVAQAPQSLEQLSKSLLWAMPGQLQ